MCKRFRWSIPVFSYAVRGLLSAVGVVVLALSLPAYSQQLAPVWALSTVTGDGSNVDSGDGGPAVNAEIARSNQVVVDKAGNLYFSEPASPVVRKIDANGIISTVAGTAGMVGYSGDGGPAVKALLSAPYGLAIDNNGNLLVSDEGNYVIRRIDAVTGVITTIAGNGTEGYTGDGGPALQASLDEAYTIVCDRKGNLYLSDYKSNVLRKIDAVTGVIITIAGTGTKGYTGDEGPAVQATVHSPHGMWLDVAGNLYFADYGNNVVRMIDTGGIIHTVAGNSTGLYTGDGGPATSATLDGPRTPAGDNLGNLYIPDENNQAIRAIDSSGIIHTIAGDGADKKGFTGDGAPATTGRTDEPYGITIDARNIITFSDNGNNRIRQLSLNTGFPRIAVGASATQNIFVQSGVDVTPNTGAVTPAAPAEFTLGTLSGCSLGATLAANTPCTVPITFAPAAPGLQTAQLAFTDASGKLSTIGLSGVGIAPATAFSIAAINTITGNGTAGNTGIAGPAASSEVSLPRGGVVDSAGNIYFADSGNNLIRRIDSATGAISTVAGSGAQGNTGDGGAATAAQLNAPAKVVVDAAGDLYIADTGNNVIRFVDANTGVISTIAGNGTAGYTGDGGAATSAELNQPQGLAVDLGGHVYVADTGNNVIRYFGKGSLITTITGTGTAGYSGDGGNDYGAQLNAPQAIALDQGGNLYIADTGNDVVRMVSALNQISTLAGQQGSATNTGDGAAATAATLDHPSDIALDAAGDMYVAAGGQVRVVHTSGNISTLAGTGATGNYSGEGGPAASAVIPSSASNLMLDNAGNVVIAATSANRVLRVTAAMPMLLNFGVQAPGTNGPATTFSVINTGNSTLNISGITASSGYTLDPAAPSACTQTTSLDPGHSCTVSIAFTPSTNATGSVSGTLTISDNSLNGAGITHTFALSGSTRLGNSTTTALSVTPSSLVYGASATVTAAVSGGSATGTVNFTVNGAPAGSAQLNSSQQATLALPGLPAGIITVGASYAGDTSNDPSSGTASVTVQPAVLTVTANDITTPLGETPAFTYTITGFVNGDTSSVVSGSPSETTTAITTSPQGTYPITIAKGTLAAVNYTFTFVNGTLTVGPPPLSDFTLDVTPGATGVAAGETATVTLTLTPLHGYKGTVNVSCSGLPANSSCSAASPLTGDSQGYPSWTQVNIYTNGQHAAADLNRSPFYAPGIWAAIGMPLCLVGLMWRKGRNRWAGRLLVLLLLAGVAAGVSSCSSGGGSSAAKGTYQVVITATDSSANLSHSATVTLTIQ